MLQFEKNKPNIKNVLIKITAYIIVCIRWVGGGLEKGRVIKYWGESLFATDHGYPATINCVHWFGTCICCCEDQYTCIMQSSLLLIYVVVEVMLAQKNHLFFYVCLLKMYLFTYVFARKWSYMTFYYEQIFLFSGTSYFCVYMSKYVCLKGGFVAK